MAKCTCLEEPGIIVRCSICNSFITTKKDKKNPCLKHDESYEFAKGKWVCSGECLEIITGPIMFKWYFIKQYFKLLWKKEKVLIGLYYYLRYTR